MLPQVFPPDASTNTNANSSKQSQQEQQQQWQSQQQQQRAGELAARASAVADEMDAAIRAEAVVRVLRIATPGEGGGIGGALKNGWFDMIDR
jgi:hypothetical protein